MSFVEVFVCAVPDANKEAYVEMCKKSSAINKQHGAQQVTYCWANDVSDGEVTSFIKAVKCEEGESVSIGWHIWESKEARDAAQPKVMEAMMEAHGGGTPMPFDGKRMILGGFDSVLEE